MDNGLAIIAGTGRLPQIVRAAHPDAAFVPIANGTNGSQAGFHAEFERMGALIRELRARNVDRLCFVGAAQRPKMRLLRLDFQTLLWLPRIMTAISRGDGRALEIARGLFESKGFEIVGAHTLVPDLIVEEPMVIVGEFAPLDIETARRTHHLMGLADDGQALVVAGNAVIATETREGTAAMLANLGDDARGGFLFKTSKFGQDLDFDMATIGPDTVDQVAKAGLGAIVIEAGRVIILDRDEVIKRAQASGITIMAIAPLVAVSTNTAGVMGL